MDRPLAGLARSYQAFYGVPRQERRILVDDDDTVYDVLCRVRIGTDDWYIYDVDHSLTDREVELRVVQVVA